MNIAPSRTTGGLRIPPPLQASTVNTQVNIITCFNKGNSPASDPINAYLLSKRTCARSRKLLTYSSLRHGSYEQGKAPSDSAGWLFTVEYCTCLVKTSFSLLICNLMVQVQVASQTRAIWDMWGRREDSPKQEQRHGFTGRKRCAVMYLDSSEIPTRRGSAPTVIGHEGLLETQPQEPSVQPTPCPPAPMRNYPSTFQSWEATDNLHAPPQPYLPAILGHHYRHPSTTTYNQSTCSDQSRPRSSFSLFLASQQPRLRYNLSLPEGELTSHLCGQSWTSQLRPPTCLT